MKARFFIVLLFLSAISVPNLCLAQTQQPTTTQAEQQVDWPFVITTLKNEGYEVTQVKMMIEALNAAIKGGLTVKDIESKEQILALAKIIQRELEKDGNWSELQDNNKAENLGQAFPAEWLPVVTVLKRGGHSTEEIKTVVKVLQEKGCKAQDFQDDEQIITQAKAIIDENKSQKWKIVAGVSAVAAIVVIGALFYFKHENDVLRAQTGALIGQNWWLELENNRLQDENHRQANRINNVEHPNNPPAQHLPNRIHINKECTICQQANPPTRSILGCGHTFHDGCIQDWFNHADDYRDGHDTCPECRRHTTIVSSFDLPEPENPVQNNA